MWQVLSNRRAGPRFEVVHNINPIYPYTSYLLGPWKYINGTVNPVYDTWLGEIPTNENPQADQYPKEVTASPAWSAVAKFSSRELNKRDILALREDTKIYCGNTNQNSTSFKCDPLKAPCLFNIQADPCETRNLRLPRTMEVVEQYLERAKKRVVDPINQPLDPRSDPALNNFQWTYWLDLLEETGVVGIGEAVDKLRNIF